MHNRFLIPLLVFALPSNGANARTQPSQPAPLASIRQAPVASINQPTSLQMSTPSVPNAAPDSVKKLDRTSPPKPAPESAVEFPDWQETVLPNGLKIIVYEQHETPTVSLRLYIKAGSANDGDKLKSASFTASLLTRGTATRDANKIAEEIDFLGADLSAAAGLDNSSLSLSILSKYLDTGLDLFQDALLHPTFPEKEVEFIRLQSLNRLRLAKADGGTLADEAFNKIVYGSHPYGNSGIGTEAALKALTRKDIERFYKAHYLPNQALLVVAGDVDSKAIVGKLTALFGNWKAGKAPALTVTAPVMSEKTKVVVVQKDGAVQSTLNIGHLGVPRSHPDYIKIYTTNMILGGYFGSRLNLNLREKNGYTYGVYSGFSANTLAGDFSVSAPVRNEVTDSAVAEIFTELRRLTTEPVSDELLNEVKNYIIGTFAIQNETPASVAARISAIELYGLPKDYYKTFRAKVKAITAAEVLETAKKYLQPGRTLIILSGDAKAVKTSLEKFGAVEVLDADGKKLPL